MARIAMFGDDRSVKLITSSASGGYADDARGVRGAGGGGTGGAERRHPLRRRPDVGAEDVAAGRAEDHPATDGGRVVPDANRRLDDGGGVGDRLRPLPDVEPGPLPRAQRDVHVVRLRMLP